MTKMLISSLKNDFKKISFLYPNCSVRGLQAPYRQGPDKQGLIVAEQVVPVYGGGQVQTNPAKVVAI